MRPTRLVLPCLSTGRHVDPRVLHSPFLGRPLSYLPCCHTYSASSQKRWVSCHLFSLSFHLLPFPSLVISVCISLYISRSHFLLIFSPTLFSLSVNDFSSTSHIFSSLQPHFLCQLSLFFLLAICPLSPSLTQVSFDETWIESGGVSVRCSSAPRGGCQGKRQAIFTLNII